MDGSIFTLVLGTDGIMLRRMRCEDRKLCVDRCVAGGVCRLLEGNNVERLYHVWTSELSVSELKHAVVQLVESLRYKMECRGFDSRLCHRDFSLVNSFRPNYDAVVDSASNRNDYQDYSLVGKDDRCNGPNITTFMCWLSRNLRAQTPGTLRACKEIGFCIETYSDIISVSRYLWFDFNWPMKFQRKCDNLKIVFF